MRRRRHNFIERFRQAIDGLPEPTRTVYRLHLFDDRDYGCIAAAAGMSTAEVEHHVALAILLIDKALRAPEPAPAS